MEEENPMEALEDVIGTYAEAQTELEDAESSVESAKEDLANAKDELENGIREAEAKGLTEEVIDNVLAEHNIDYVDIVS
jgi:predicted  nucleic acid-binding Zn-ribbon protein